MTMPGKSNVLEIQLKRIYEPLDAKDGLRVFVDRLWARGMSKADARLDAWMKELGPSDELRQWFGHRAERWTDFQERYRRELSAPVRQLFLALLQSAARTSTTTLLYGARDSNQNEAVVLREYLLGHRVNLTQGVDSALTLAAAVAAVAAAHPSGEASESSLLTFVDGLLSASQREAAFLALQGRGELVKGHGGWRLTARGQRLLRAVPAEYQESGPK
jgi:uncharacterized protein YeaO (DUF488 family)